MLNTQKETNKFISNIYKKADDDKSISCFECNELHCCRKKKSISVSGLEKKVLRRIITKEHRERARVQIVQHALTGYYSCPFLDNDGKCSIYLYRPIACSSYMVTTGADGCSTPHGKSGIVDPIFALRHLPEKYIKKISKSGQYDLLDIFKELK